MAAATGTAGYTVLARRFRPQAFGEVVGQEHIAQALRNAIRANRVAHAYLFTGARGVGKTSSARILAKALNCPTAIDGDPCNECEICRGISAGNDVDVSEIDGASNRGIDDIRQLRSNVNVKSMRTKFKVYIIDEVHMLTKEAFNALLKTLEEPPPNVIFVFCTTEPNKVPDTILSRCQRFDFGTIATDSIKLRLQQIAEAEGVQVDDEAFELVSRRAAGSMRDSQSIFDQLLAFGELHITASEVHRLLGTASDDRLISIIDTVVGRDPGAAIAGLHEALDGGAQLGELTDQLLFYLRDMMVIAAGATSVELLSVSVGSKPALQAQSKKWGLQTIISAMQILADTKSRMQRTTYGRALAELALVRLALLENMQNLDALIKQMKSSEPIEALPSPTLTPSQLPNEKKNDLVDPGSVLVVVEAPIEPGVVPAIALVKPLETKAAALNETPPSSVSEKWEGEAPAEPQPLKISGSAGASPSRNGLLGQTPRLALDRIDTDETSQSVTSKTELPPAESAPRSAQVVQPPERATSPVVPTPTPNPEALDDDDILAQFGMAPDEDSFEASEPFVSRPVAVTRPQPTPPRPPVPAPQPTASESLLPAEPLGPLPPADELWKRVLAEINDMLKGHAKTAARAVVIGPNKLELVFPQKCNFHRRYCEKPECLRRLEDITSRIAGRTMKIATSSCEDEPESTSNTASKSATGKQTRVYKPEEDAYVANVMNLFAAECVKVEPVLTAKGHSDESN